MPRRSTPPFDLANVSRAARRARLSFAAVVALSAAVAGPALLAPTGSASAATDLASGPFLDEVVALLNHQDAPAKPRIREAMEPGRELSNGGSKDKDRGRDGGRSPRWMRDGGGPLRPEDFPTEKFLAVARDIEPEWASRLEERLASDRDATVRSIAQNGRRFMGLVVIRDKNPQLYRLKVDELKLQIETRRVAEGYHEALSGNRVEDMAVAETSMRDRARASINAGLRARAEELQALESAVKRFREELEADAKSVDSDVDAMVERLKKQKPGPGLMDAIGGRGSGGPPLTSTDRPPEPAARPRR